MFSRVKLIPCHGRMPESGDSRACFLSWCESRFLILVNVFMLTSIFRLLGILLLFLPRFLVLLLLDQEIFFKNTFTHNFRLIERYENSLEIS